MEKIIVLNRKKFKQLTYKILNYMPKTSYKYNLIIETRYQINNGSKN